MFEIGFSEILIVAVIALLVLGPEKLPKAARYAGLWVRRARAQWYSVKAEFERELAQEELRRSLSEPLADIATDADQQMRALGAAARAPFEQAAAQLTPAPASEPMPTTPSPPAPDSAPTPAPTPPEAPPPTPAPMHDPMPVPTPAPMHDPMPAPTRDPVPPSPRDPPPGTPRDPPPGTPRDPTPATPRDPAAPPS